MSIISRIALALVIIGGINWGLIGFFQFDLVAAIFGGQDSILARIVYALVGLSALVSLGLLFMNSEERDEGRARASYPRYERRNVQTEFGKEADFRKEREASQRSNRNEYKK